MTRLRERLCSPTNIHTHGRGTHSEGKINVKLKIINPHINVKILSANFFFFLDCIFPCRGSQGGGAGAYFSWQCTPLDEPAAHLRALFEHSVPYSRVPQQ